MMGQPGRSGKQGIMGPPGIGGEKGIQGDTGAPGIPGQKGSKGDTGALGVPGAKGIKGDTGAPGVPGMKGKPLFEHTIPLCGGLVTQSIGGLDAIKTVQIPDDYKLVSFDVKSLFNSIPLQLALHCTTKTAINNSTIELPLPTYDLMALLNLCLTFTCFQYDGKHYKQLHGTAIVSPVSVVVAKIVMQNIEERALGIYKRTLPLWLRYVDDTFTTVHKDEIDIFTNTSTDKTPTYSLLRRSRKMVIKNTFSRLLSSS